MTFQQASELYSRCRNKYQGYRLTGRATWLVQCGTDAFGIQYHNTIIVKIHRDGSYTLNSGGYRTNTTKDRINEYAPARIFQHRFVWYASEGVEFNDGMILNAIERKAA